ncbi:MAG: hypothetical protein ACOC6H_03700 [Thermoproteota archaeon]
MNPPPREPVSESPWDTLPVVTLNRSFSGLGETETIALTVEEVGYMVVDDRLVGIRFDVGGVGVFGGGSFIFFVIRCYTYDWEE